MTERLQVIMQSDAELTKEEINNFVFKGIKPNKKKKREDNQEINKEEKEKEKEKKINNKNEKNDKEEENHTNEKKAFITSIEQE